MASTEAPQPSYNPIDPPSSPRISFSVDFLDEPGFIPTKPDPSLHKESDGGVKTPDFEFLSSQSQPRYGTMSSADELFHEGKLLPFCQMQTAAERIEKISLKSDESGEQQAPAKSGREEPRIWLMDDDTSPRPPNCTVLLKELLRLKKQRAASSLSSSSSGDHAAPAEKGKVGKVSGREKHVRRIKKGLERTRSASMRIRPMVNVPICTQGKSSALPPLFSLKKGRVSIGEPESKV